jgi:hypothetical protein
MGPSSNNALRRQRFFIVATPRKPTRRHFAPQMRDDNTRVDNHKANCGAALGLNPPSLHLSTSLIFQRFIVPLQIARHHHGFQPNGCRRFIGGTVEVEHILCGKAPGRITSLKSFCVHTCTGIHICAFYDKKLVCVVPLNRRTPCRRTSFHRCRYPHPTIRQATRFLESIHHV